MGNCSKQSLVLSNEKREIITRRLRQVGVESSPRVTTKVVEILADPGAGPDDIAKIVRADAAIVGRLIKMANSAYFAQATEVTSVERACVVLGKTHLRALLLSFYLARVTPNDENAPLTRRVWGEAIFRASFATALAERVCPHLSGEAFVIGLMLDRGVALMPKLVGSWYTNLVDQAQTPMDLHIQESTLLDYTHVDVIAVLCEKWMLPTLLARPIVLHHAPPGNCNKGLDQCKLCGIGYYAGQLDLRLDSHLPIEMLPSPQIAQQLFGLPGDDLIDIRERAIEEYELTRAMFDDIADDLGTIDALRAHISKQLGDAVDAALLDTMEEQESTQSKQQDRDAA